jgi:hypothetical protein
MHTWFRVQGSGFRASDCVGNGYYDATTTVVVAS